MGAAAGNAGGAAPRPGAMGGYELVRSDDAPALAVDLEAGGGGGCAKRGAGTSPAPASPSPARQRLVSLDVFRGITVLVRPQQNAP